MDLSDIENQIIADKENQSDKKKEETPSGIVSKNQLLLLKTQNNKKFDIHVNQIEGLCSSKKFIIDLKRKYY